jgi:hypothetical protein
MALSLGLSTAAVGQSDPPAGKRVLLVKDGSIGALAASARYLVWEQAPLLPRSPSAAQVFERDSRTQRVTRLASDGAPPFGLATTSKWVGYGAAGAAGRTKLLAIRHGGGARVTLSRSLIAPIASRGERIAWAEQSAQTQRVVVRDMRTGTNWIAAELPRCRGLRCYRIDAVELAADGVVFDRGSIGTQPSLIMRRRFGGSKLEALRLPRDPQPDLAPSEAGALFYWLGHGWRRWDFGRGSPRAAAPRHDRWWILASENGRMLLSANSSQCRESIALRTGGGRTLAVAAPASTPASPRGFGRLCRLLDGFSWRNGRLLVAWTIVPDISLRSHVGVGAVGVVVATPTS